MSRTCSLLSVLLVAIALSYSNAFAPTKQMAIKSTSTSSPSAIHMGFGMPDEDTKKLTRENEPGKNKHWRKIICHCCVLVILNEQLFLYNFYDKKFPI